MIASSTGKIRPASARGTTRRSRQYQQQPGVLVPCPAAGAHAAAHLINEDATPGAGALPNRSYSGKDVDGAAG